MPDPVRISDLDEATSVTSDDLVEVTIQGTPKFSKRAKISTILASVVASLAFHTSNTSNPHSVTKTQVGLSAVPNTDATDRANHTGTQATSTVSGLQTALDAKVVGPASATDNAIVRFDSTTGKLVQNSSITVSDGGAITMPGILSSASGISAPSATISGNISVTGTVDGRDVSTDGTKLDSIATGATANDSDANLKNRANHTGTQTASTISDFSTAADARITAQKAQNSGLASLDSGGKVPTSQLPGLALTDVYTVDGEEDQLDLTVQEGDVAIRTDENKSYVHNGGTTGTMDDWSELLTPTDSVISVNGQTGSVSLDADDISDSGTTHKFVTASDLTNLDNLSGTNTGDQSSVTGNAGTATKLATARTIDGQSFDGSANITVVAPGTHATSSKTTPVDADELPLIDSAASNVLKKLTWANLKATTKTYFDTLYVPLARTVNGKSLSSNITLDIDDVAPTQTGNSGKYLKTDGSNATWQTVDAGDSLPDQTGNSGKFLSTDGSDASWETVSTGGLGNVVEDTTPQLGGDLDLNSHTVGDATAADLTKLHDLTATATELNYVDGVTSAIQTQLDDKVSLDSDFFITGDGTAGITNSTPGIGLGVETGGNNNAHMEINSPENGVAYIDFTVVDEDFKMRLAWEDANDQMTFSSEEGTVLTLAPDGDVTAAGELTAANLSGTNTGDQDLSALAPKASPTFSGTVTLPSGLTGVLRADSGVVSTDSDVTDLVGASSDTAAGKVELATTAETTTGTDATRAVTPDGLHDMTSLAGAAWFLDEDNMASDSATKTASQQSVKAYADTKVPATRTINGNALSSNVTLDIDDVAPTQTGNSGKYLTTDGTNATWGTVSAGDGDTNYFNDYHTNQSGLTSSGLDALTGSVNSSNTTFTVSDAVYVEGTLQVFLNGVLQVLGDAITETTPASGIFDFVTAPETGGQIYVRYATQETTSDTVVVASDLADVATSGDYGDLVNTPTLGTAAAGDTGDFATAAQGVLADSAVQDLSDLSITATASELNALDGITASVTELNYTDGVTSAIQTQLDGKVPTSRTVNGSALSSNVTLTQDSIGDGTTYKQYSATEKTKLSGIASNATANDTDANLKNRANHTGTQALSTISDVTASAAEVNVLDGVTSSTAELNILDGVTTTASELNALDGITATVTELNYTDGVTSAIQTQLDAKVDESLLSASGKGFCNHGSTAATARPTAYASIEWYGDVEPDNAASGDTWIDTSA